MTDDILIELGPDDSIVDFAHKIADQLFENLRLEVTEIDQAAEPFIQARFGEDDASFLLLVLGHLAADMTRYASYMAAGIYMTAGTKDEEGNHDLARNAVKALLKDQKRAAQLGLLAAELRTEEIFSDEPKNVENEPTCKDMLDELLKKRKGGMN
jgi:hypothetical protein